MGLDIIGIYFLLQINFQNVILQIESKMLSHWHPKQGGESGK